MIGGDDFRDDKVTSSPTAAPPSRPAPAPAPRPSAPPSAPRCTDVAAAGLTEPRRPSRNQPIPDAISYRFTYRGHQVETDTGKLPDELRRLIGTFNDLIERYGA